MPGRCTCTTTIRRPTSTRLLAGDYLDPISGFPGYKASLCAVQEGRARDRPARAGGDADEPRLLPGPRPLHRLHGLRGGLHGPERPGESAPSRQPGGRSSRSRPAPAPKPGSATSRWPACTARTRPASWPAPRGAIAREPGTRAVKVDAELCIGCHSCSIACPFGVPRFGKDGTMQKCDLCSAGWSTAWSRPACGSARPRRCARATRTSSRWRWRRRRPRGWRAGRSRAQGRQGRQNMASGLAEVSGISWMVSQCSTTLPSSSRKSR